MSIDIEWEKVKEFHSAFHHPISNFPTFMNADRANKRYKWMLEEIDEFLESSTLERQADAIIDLIYFALGTLVELGIKPERMFEIVHQANMSKLWEDGKPHFNEDGKVIKPDTWQDPEPNLKNEICNQIKQANKRMHNYKPIKSKPFYCIPTCLEIILKAINVSVSQEYLSELIGIETASGKDLELGTKIELNALNNITQLLGLEYSFAYLRATEFEEWLFGEKLASLLEHGNHVICTLSAGKLYNNSDLELGHAVVVKKLESDKVEVVDPGPENFGFKTFTLEQLYVASRYREGGLLVLSKKDPLQ